MRATLHPLLVELVDALADVVDTALIEGARSVEQQRRNVEAGVSQTMDSRHLDVPARAVDAGPYPIIWPTLPESVRDALTREQREELARYTKLLARWYHWAGVVRGIASERKIPVRLGADWDGDSDFLDQVFDDLPHVELLPD